MIASLLKFDKIFNIDVNVCVFDLINIKILA